MPRLFVAVWPPASVLTRLHGLPKFDDASVRVVPPENWHVTLRFLGEADPDGVAATIDDRALPTTTAVLGPTVRRLGNNIVVPVSGLDELAATVQAATVHVGQPLDKRRFAGHLTLARLRSVPAREFVGAPVDAAFTVEEVCLVESETRHDGARYRIIRRWQTV